ncbi:phage tail protein, partial [Pseudomonas aeruginosa]
GTGTQFSSNVRVGDAFIAPDGRLYEVSNVASSTVMSIKPNYRGSTASGQAYAVAPILGYDKDLSDRFNQIAMDWGATLAGIKPWALSNTGTQAQADMGMTAVGRGLNAAATAENALSFIGGMPKSMSNLRAVSDANNVPNECGFYGISVGPWANLPPGIDALNPIGSMLYHHPYDVATAVQLFVPRTSNILYFRRRVAGAWQSWVRVLSDAQLLGTVAQSGGVPLGSILERGSNANGQYARLADGTQICTTSLLGANDRMANTSYILTLPAAFTPDWTVGVSVSWVSHATNPATYNGVKVAYANDTSVSFILAENLTTNRLIFSCIGRWF